MPDDSGGFLCSSLAFRPVRSAARPSSRRLVIAAWAECRRVPQAASARPLRHPGEMMRRAAGRDRTTETHRVLELCLFGRHGPAQPPQPVAAVAEGRTAAEDRPRASGGYLSGRRGDSARHGLAPGNPQRAGQLVVIQKADKRTAFHGYLSTSTAAMTAGRSFCRSNRAMNRRSGRRAMRRKGNMRPDRAQSTVTAHRPDVGRVISEFQRGSVSHDRRCVLLPTARRVARFASRSPSRNARAARLFSMPGATLA